MTAYFSMKVYYVVGYCRKKYESNTLVIFQSIKYVSLVARLRKVTVVLGFYVLPTAKVIRRRDLDLKSHPKDWRSPGSNSRPLDNKASGLTTTPRRLLLRKVMGDKDIKAAVTRNWYNQNQTIALNPMH